MKLNIVPARTGITWVKLGITTFFKQPLALAGLFFLYMAAIILISQLPFVGIFIGGMLVPAATLGLMAAAAEASTGKFPMPAVLLSAFRAGRAQGRAMLILGAIYTGASVLVTALANLLAGPVSAGACQNIRNSGVCSARASSAVVSSCTPCAGVALTGPASRLASAVTSTEPPV